MATLSIVICCANCEDTLEQACQSATWCDELIVVDSGSTDSTPHIAQQYADRYILEPWRGHTGQKQFAARLCKNDWVFFLDGDEECSPELTQELQALDDRQLEDYDLFLVPRRNHVMGRHVRAWSPDHLTRIFHRGRCQWGNHVLHDTRSPSSRSRMTKLRGHLIHKQHSRAHYADYFSGKRMDERLMDVAQLMYDHGDRCSFADLILRPTAAFLKFYFLKRGFLDGSFGLLIAQKAAISTQLKYSALWAIQHQVSRATSDKTTDDQGK